MTLTRRTRGVLAAVGAAALVAFGMFQLAKTGSCSTPPEDGLPPCPDTILRDMASMVAGIALSVYASARTNPAVGSCAASAGVGAGLLVAVAAGEAGSVARAIGVGVLALAAVLLVAAVRGLERAWEDDLLMTGGGVFADGTVLEVRPTETTLGNDRVYFVRMRIDPFGMMPSYEGAQSVPLPAAPVVGERCPVWVRPGDPDRWVFRTAAADVAPLPAPVPGDVVVHLAALNAARRNGRIDTAEFARLARIVLGTS